MGWHHVSVLSTTKTLGLRNASFPVGSRQQERWYPRYTNLQSEKTKVNKMRMVSKIAFVVLSALLLVSIAQADVLTVFTTSIASNDPTQLGRISRNGIPSDWGSLKTFPGIINPTTTYNYHTYSVNSGVTPYIFITIDSVTANTFASAYFPTYNPTTTGANHGMDVNYIGDAGSSGNYFGVDPISFEVYVPVHSDFLVVVNTSSNAGIGQPFTITVQGFLDDQFTSTPEPSSLALLGSGVLGVAGLVRRKLRLG